MCRVLIAGLVPALALSSSAIAQIARDCPALPAPLAAWNSRASLVAAGDAAGLGSATLAIGKAADLALKPTSTLHYAMRPEKPGDAGSHGGMARFTVARGGNVRVALGAGAWIDVVQGGKPVRSTNHGHGVECTGVRKMVDFSLKPGEYILQISGNAAPTIAVMIATLP